MAGKNMLIGILMFMLVATQQQMKWYLYTLYILIYKSNKKLKDNPVKLYGFTWGTIIKLRVYRVILFMKYIQGN